MLPLAVRRICKKDPHYGEQWGCCLQTRLSADAVTQWSHQCLHGHPMGLQSYSALTKSSRTQNSTQPYPLWSCNMAAPRGTQVPGAQFLAFETSLKFTLMLSCNDQVYLGFLFVSFPSCLDFPFLNFVFCSEAEIFCLLSAYSEF